MWVTGCYGGTGGVGWSGRDNGWGGAQKGKKVEMVEVMVRMVEVSGPLTTTPSRLPDGSALDF